MCVVHRVELMGSVVTLECKMQSVKSKKIKKEESLRIIYFVENEMLFGKDWREIPGKKKYHGPR